jgi:GPH family glycoside/pentoside/hexuronide:cation symporter
MVMWNYDVTEDRANEIRAELDSRKKGPEEKTSGYYQGQKLLSLIPLKMAERLDSDLHPAQLSNGQIKSAFVSSLKSGLHGLCFSPYEEGQDIGDILSEQQIRRRMDIISPYVGGVRSFSCTEGNEFIPKVAREKGLKTMVGAWISKDKAQNEKEINSLIELAKAGVVDIAAVGNEVLLRGELSKDELIHYIRRVKKALPNIQVGCVDTYYQFHEHTDLADACDVLLANCYPFWEDCSIDQATVYLDQMYQVVNKISKGKPVIIAETGWPGGGEALNNAQPSPENAMKYFVNVNNWREKKNIPLFYFSSFDESWKVHHEGDVGQRWGIWDKNEKLKYS